MFRAGVARRETTRMPKLIRSAQLLALLALLGCQASLRPHYSTTESALQLSRVVLYRNGIAYFERTGVTSGDRLALKVRKDQINDLLKSLTVVDRRSNKTLSISIPLDPQAWQDAALAMLMPGRGRLAEVVAPCARANRHGRARGAACALGR
jgi:hypothetical protein